MSPRLLECSVDEIDLARLAERIALKAAKGDVIALIGDLGAGKTTFARFFIRALLGNDEAEVPSPTFSLIQTYDSGRVSVAHADLYRLSAEEEADELGLDDIRKDGVLLLEWPDRAPDLVGPDRLELRLSAGPSDTTRLIRLAGHGSWSQRLARLENLIQFIDRSSDWRGSRASFLQGDASTRAYARLLGTKNQVGVLMDQPRQADGPPIRGGLPYSRIAHLAEDVRPFVAVAGALRNAGLSAPEIYEADLETGFLILEDFGDRVFGREMTAGTSQAELWRAATDTLARLAEAPADGPFALPDGTHYVLPRQDAGVLMIEAELLVDWYWPQVHGGSLVLDTARSEFSGLWTDIIGDILQSDLGWVLRDYHSPNLMWLPERHDIQRVGLLDFQDALIGSAAYDLVSLLQDARVDVPAELEAELLGHYCRARRGQSAQFDETAFRYLYAALGAQRNTKILGIFARLAARDHKPHYLAHIPRIWTYLERCLAHPGLDGLRAWYDGYFPRAARPRSNA